ncbi:MAG: putative ABC transporter ATP-binding protein [Firmicutes bacterium ADurb.Bin356]|nr:MAG: putative ABC transporter ATP-binding protein [Firmicutes bacterium ADurb.Bin356]
MLKRLAAYIGEYKKQTLLTPVMIIFEVSLEVAIPFLMARIINIGIANSDTSYITTTGLTMIGIALFSLLFGALAARFSSTAAAGFAKNLRAALFSSVQEFSFANLDKFSTASLVTRLTTDVTNAQNTFMMLIRMAVRAPLMLLSSILMTISINSSLAVIFLLASPLLGAILAWVISIAHPRFLKMLKQYDKMNAVVQENLIGIRVVKAFVRENHETEKFTDASNRVRQLQFEAERVVVWTMPIMQFVIYACMLAIAWFGGVKVIKGTMLTGDLMSFMSYAMQILISLMMLSMVFVMVIITRASYERILEVLDEEPTIQNPVDGGLTSVNDGSIEFSSVSFSYSIGSEEKTLKDIELNIQPGETVGIIGATGSAKTTLVQLIPRLYDVQSGSVHVGGHDVREYNLQTLRDAVAMVLQNNVLFSGTIRENLKWGNEHATEEDISKVCRIAQAHDFILSFPDGYDTNLGQGGVNLSGGQKQRLCIARALLKNPKIMLLDDSLSAVDTATDNLIRTGLRKHLKGMTVLIIAQRIASVMDADKIIVLDEGTISTVGTHADLMRSSEIYSEVYFSQRKGVDEHGA